MVNKLSLVWGVETFYLSEYNQIDAAVQDSLNYLKENDLIHEGNIVVHVASTPLNLHGRTNTMKASIV